MQHAVDEASGALRRLPSKRWQASYVGPDLQRHPAPSTFETKIDAEAWLASERQLIDDARWLSPGARRREAERKQAASITLEQYATEWLTTQDLRPLTRTDYGSLLRNHILPTLGSVRLAELSRATVRSWYARLPRDRPRARSKAFQLLHAILNYAVDDDMIEVNPAALGRRTSARPKRAKRIRPLTVDQVEAIADGMPARLRVAALLGCWCALRYGELTELRRKDVDVAHAMLRVERAVIRVNGAYVPSPPKTDAGIRDVHIPPFLVSDLAEHMAKHVGRSRDSLLFPADSGEHLHSSSFARFFAKAATAAGRHPSLPASHGSQSGHNCWGYDRRRHGPAWPHDTWDGDGISTACPAPTRRLPRRFRVYEHSPPTMNDSPGRMLLHQVWIRPGRKLRDPPASADNAAPGT